MDPPVLTTRAKLLFASSSIGSEALAQSRSTWLLYFYAPPADANLRSLLPVGLAGAILFVDGLTGAVYNPLVGHLSDRSHSRLGRRLPFVLVATPFWALFALLVFIPPPDAGTAATAAFLFLTVELYAAFSALSGGPYQALLPEIARTSGERVTVVGMRVYCGALGGAAGLVGSGLLVDHAGFGAMAAAMALLALTFRYVGVLGAWRYASRTEPPVTLSFRDALGTTLRNTDFRRLLPSVVLFLVSVQVVLGVLPYDVKAILHVSKAGTWVAILTAVAIVSMIISVPFAARLARRSSKRAVYRRAMLGAAVVFPALAFAGELPILPAAVQLILVMAVAGPALSGIYLFPDALMADVIDHDSRATGMRREAMFFGASNLMQQAAGALAPLLLGAVLLLGDTRADQLGSRLAGPLAGALVLAGWLAFRRYDLPDEMPAA